MEETLSNLHKPRPKRTDTHLVNMAPPPEMYPNVYRIADPSNVTKDDLSQIIQTYPVIDNHAHNMLLEEHAYGGPDHPFESITSEASGHALFDHVPFQSSTYKRNKAIGGFLQVFRVYPRCESCQIRVGKEGLPRTDQKVLPKVLMPL